jgi:hypothetical protein
MSVAAGVALCVLAQGCAAPGGNSAHAPIDAPVAAAGTANAPSLTNDQRAELDAAVAAAPPAVRAHLRYAIAKDGAGKDRLAVYDPGADPTPEHRHKNVLVYAVYRLINTKDGSDYDPQQDAIIDPVPMSDQKDPTEASVPRS